MNRMVNTCLLAGMFCFLIFGESLVCAMTCCEQPGYCARAFLEQFAPPFVYDNTCYQDNITNLVIRAWSKLDLLQAFHTEDHERILFSREVVDDILLLYALLVIADKQQFDWFVALRKELVERITMMKQTSEILFDQLVSDEAATIRLVLAKILALVSA